MSGAASGPDMSVGTVLCACLRQVSLTPIKDGCGFVTNFVAVLSDVTERKASEAAFQLRDHALSNLNEVRARVRASPTCILPSTSHSLQRVHRNVAIPACVATTSRGCPGSLPSALMHCQRRGVHAVRIAAALG